MEFRLVGGSAKGQCHSEREAPHQEGATPAAERPRQHPPLTDYGSYLAPKGSYEVAGQFPELVTNVGAFQLRVPGALSHPVARRARIVILKPDGPGSVISQGGDLDAGARGGSRPRAR